MEYKHNFAGVSSNYDVDFNNEFIEVFDDCGESIYVTKDEYVCYLGSKTVYYRLALQIQDGAEFGSDNKLYVNLFLVPSFRSLCKENRESVISFCGYDVNVYKEQLEEYKKKDCLFYFEDAIGYGFTVYLYEDSYDYKDSAEFGEISKRIKSDLASVYTGITGMIGFFLDRPINRIGMDGWMWLRHICNNVKMSTITKELHKKYAS